MRLAHLVLAFTTLAAGSLVACGGNKDASSASAPTCPPAASVAPVAVATSAPTTTSTATPSASVAVKVATPDPKDSKGAKSDATAQKLSIGRIAIARDVKNREPIDVGTRFDTSEPKVFVFLDVRNTEKAPGTLFVEFVSPKAGARGDIELQVGSTDHYRTWAFTRLAKEPGTWKARIKNERGDVIAEQSFEVFSVD